MYKNISRSPWNYWTLETTIKQLNQFIDSNPDFKKKTSVSIIETGHGSALVRAIYKFGGLRKLNNEFKLGLNIKYRRWSKEEVFEELRKIKEKGIIITQKNLADLDRNDLLGAITKYGNLNQFKRVLGLPIKRYCYWTDEIIINELKSIILDFGRIPSGAVLKCIGRNDLGRAIAKKGGFKKFSKLIGTNSINYYLANDGDYLQSGYECLFDNVLFKYNIPHKVHEKISGQYNYRSDFLIHNTHIEICGYDEKEHPEYFERLQKKKKLYADLKLSYLLILKKTFNANIVKIEKNLVELLQEVPLVQTDLFIAPINNSNIKPASYWADLNNIKKELFPLVKKYGRMPLDHEMRTEKKGSLISAIYRLYGSTYELSKILNIKCLYKPKGYYTQQNSIMEYTELCVEHNKFLSLQELHKIKAYGLAGYIRKNGGYFKIRALMNLTFPIRKISNNHYSFEKAAMEYKQLCLEKGGFISSKGLGSLGAGALATYIQRHGGYYVIRKVTNLNFPPLVSPRV